MAFANRFITLGIAGMLLFSWPLRAQDTNNLPVVAPVALPADTSTDTSKPSPTVVSMSSMEALNDKSKLGNGDRITYSVLEEQQEPKVLMVSDSGELDVPLVGRVTAAGKTCKQLAYELKPILEKQYFYHATVIIGVETFSTQSRGKVYLMGQVQRQGAIEIPATDNLTVSRAILLDGGLADFADRRKVKLVRKKADGTSDTTIVDLVEILDHGKVDKDPVLKPDDVIIVPQRLINF